MHDEIKIGTLRGILKLAKVDPDESVIYLKYQQSKYKDIYNL